MKKITKEQCLDILANLKEEAEFWEWDEDYYNSGYNGRESRIDWFNDRMDFMYELVKSSDAFEQ